MGIFESNVGEGAAKGAEAAEGACRALLAKPAVSRRAFFGMAGIVGALHFLGMAAGGRVYAYADDAGSKYFVIVVLSKEEIAALTLDGSNQAADPVALPGVSVTVKSRHNDEAASGTTGSDGICILNVKKLLREGTTGIAAAYSGFVSVELKKEGYRETAYTRQYVEGGPQKSGKAHISLVSQPFNAGETDAAYLRMATFDGSDLLHHAASIPKYAVNTINHDFVFQVACAPGKQVEIALLADEKLVGTAQTVAADSDGFASCTMSGPYVRDFAIGTKFACRFKVGATTRVANLTLDIVKPSLNYEGYYAEDQFAFSMGSGGGPMPGASREKETEGFFLGTYNARFADLPPTAWGSGQQLMLDLPWLPIGVVVDPRGAFGLSFTTEAFNIFSNFNGKKIGPSFENWGKSMLHPFKGWGENFVGSIEDSINLYDALKQAREPGHAVNGKAVWGFSLAANYQLAGLLFCMDPSGALDKPYLNGTIAQTISIICYGELGSIFVVGPVPMFAGFDFAVLASFNAEHNVKSFPLLEDPEFSRPSIGPHGEGGYTITLFLDAGFSIGVGFKGIVSAAIRGYFQIPLIFIFKGVPGLKYPGKLSLITGGAQACLQFLFFTYRVGLNPPVYKKFIDNWNMLPDTAENGEAEPFDDFYFDPAFGDDDGQWHYANAESLAPTAELSATLSDKGVLCDYVTLGLALPSEEALAAACQGMKDPYTSANGEAYDPAKGLKPCIEEAFCLGGEEKSVFSDSRMKIIQLGNVLYYCRIATVEVKQPTELSNLDAMVDGEDAGDIFFVPREDAMIPHVEFEWDNQKEEGSLVQSGNYGDVALYKDETSENAPMAVAHTDIPIDWSYDDAVPAEPSQEEIQARMIEVAQALGWQLDAAEERADMTLADPNRKSTFQTRVVVAAFDLATRQWVNETPDVIDFAIPSQATGTMRCNMNDVDFYPVADEDGKSILFGLVSCTRALRKRRDNPEKMKRSLFTTVLRYTPSSTGHGKISDVNSNVADFMRDDKYEWVAIPCWVNRYVSSALFRDRCLGLTTTGKYGSKNAVINHFYLRDEARSTEGAFELLGNHVLLSDEFDDNGSLQTFVQHTDKSDTIIVCWQQVNGQQSLALEGISSASKDIPGRPSKPGDAKAFVWSLSTGDTGAKLGEYVFADGENFMVLGQSKGFAWLKRNDQTKEVRMYNVRVNPEDGTLRDYENPYDFGRVNINRFFSAGGGDMLYGARIQEGTAPQMGEEAIAVLREIRDAGGEIYQNDSGFCAFDANAYLDKVEACAGIEMAPGERPEDVRQYQVIAARWDEVHQRYREFFPYAKLEKAPDDLAAFPLMPVGGCLGGTSMVYSTITDAVNHQAALTYAEVTPVPLLAFQSVACFDSFVGEGKWTIHPRVQVMNTGNMPICGFKVTFTIVNGKGLRLQVTKQLEHLEEHVRQPQRAANEASVLERMNEQGWTANESDDVFVYRDDDAGDWSKDDEAIIWPGATRIYELAIEIDIDLKRLWDKENTVTVGLSDAEVPELGKGKRDSQGNLLDAASFETEANFPDPRCVFVGVDGVANTWVIKVDESAYSAEDGLTSCDYATTGGSTPKTGDVGGLIATGAAVAAVAAGAMAAGARVLKSREED